MQTPKLNKKDRASLNAEMKELNLTRERLDSAFIHILGKDYCDFLGANLTSKHNAAILNIFINKLEHNKGYHETVKIIRAAYRDLTDRGQYTFIDE